MGNRLNHVVTQGGTTTRLASYGATDNRITGMTENGAALRTYTHDGNGNVLTDTRPGEVFAFTYNVRNRPTSVTRNGVAYATYVYNGLEQLVSRSTTASGGPTGTIHHIYDLDGHLIAEADGATGATTREYLWLDDLSIGLVQGGTLYLVHSDHLARPIRVTDATRATQWQATWGPWGDPHAISGTLSLDLRFPGQLYQIETGLHYNWHRHYDPITGRYTQPDPLRFVDGPSVYAYAGSSPFIYVDSEGRSSFDKYWDRYWNNTTAREWVAEKIAIDLALPDSTDWAAAGKIYYYSGAMIIAGIVDVCTPGPDEESEPNDKRGCIYCVDGKDTKSGKDYIGSTDNLEERKRDKRDGRNRQGAEVVDTYQAGDREARRNKEQEIINRRGGKGNLDNRRNEVAPKYWPTRGIR